LIKNYADAIRNGTKFSNIVYDPSVVCVASDLSNPLVKGYGGSGIYLNNPTIKALTETPTECFMEYYRHTCTDEFIDELFTENPSQFKGLDIKSIKSEMAKLRGRIDNTKNLAKNEGLIYDFLDEGSFITNRKCR
jgi:hypothetical protein